MIERLALDAVQLKRRQGSQTGAVMNSSEDLIARARAGDQDAFRLIFERYSRPMISFLYQLVSERDLAEDLTQETFVRAYGNLNKLRDLSKFSTWLFGIGRNVAREAVRGRRLANENLLAPYPYSSDHANPTCIDTPADSLLGRELNFAMQKALRALDEDKRVVFVLKVLQERSYQEIAEITGFSVAKVKTELHRARIAMRQRLRHYVEVKQ